MQKNIKGNRRASSANVEDTFIGKAAAGIGNAFRGAAEQVDYTAQNVEKAITGQNRATRKDSANRARENAINHGAKLRKDAGNGNGNGSGRFK